MLLLQYLFLPYEHRGYELLHARDPALEAEPIDRRLLPGALALDVVGFPHLDGCSKADVLRVIRPFFAPPSP
ncbi:pDP71L [African swine fever virus]|uniref:PDP71L n=1 Tax=African swine fever virus TaxID=10497 RepID=A0A894KN02_ASF|nr:pDP71L [African swine fever virus]